MASSIHSALIAAPALGLLFLSACGDKADARLEKLSAGISKDSVLAVMGVEKPQRVDPFLINGQFIEAMYFPKSGAADSASVSHGEAGSIQPSMPRVRHCSRARASAASARRESRPSELPSR